MTRSDFDDTCVICDIVCVFAADDPAFRTGEATRNVIFESLSSRATKHIKYTSAMSFVVSTPAAANEVRPESALGKRS